MRYDTLQTTFLGLLLVLLACLAGPWPAWANHILIPMDNTQKEHLKAYGIAYWLLGKQVEVDWLLNYRGGSFACDVVPGVENELAVRGVSYQVISEAQYTGMLSEIADPNANMDVMKLEKVPKIAVYTPKGKQPWDDAVTLVLTYAEIPYDPDLRRRSAARRPAQVRLAAPAPRGLHGRVRQVLRLLPHRGPGTSSSSATPRRPPSATASPRSAR